MCNLRPTSRGSVHLADLDVRADPVIQPRYLSTEHDQIVAVEGLKMVHRVMQAPAFEKYVPKEARVPANTGSGDGRTDAQWLQAARHLGTTIFHPAGTCRMGRRGDNSVVDSQLRVHGVKGLRVVDASVMPTITSGNTANPTMAIAETAAALILGQDDPAH